MSQEFSQVKIATNFSTPHNLSNFHVTTTDFGKIIPIMWREVVPGDKWEVDPNVFIRLFPLAAPCFGHVKVRVHSFFVPNRIMWKEWDNFIIGKSAAVPPYLSVSNMAYWLSSERSFDPAMGNPRGLYTDLMSNLGISPMTIMRRPNEGEQEAYYLNLPAEQPISAFPFLAYQRIWFDWFRDANLNQDENWFDQFTSQSRMSQQLTAQLMAVRDACFKKDYFTTCKKNPQDGDPASATTSFKRATPSSATSSNPVYAKSTTGSSDVDLHLSGTYSSDLSVSSVLSVPMMRLATAYQRYKERNNFVGSRFLDRIFANYGVKPTPERLDMAEYIDGFDFPVAIGDITSTSQYQSSSPWGLSGLGAQAGKGIASSQRDDNDSHKFSYFATEHGILMSVMSILPDTGYYQGLHRAWTRGHNGDGHLEFFNENFENLGFQPVLNRELYVPNDLTEYQSYQPDGVWGFAPRYSDYKWQPDILGGDFTRWDTYASADSFHLFRKLHYTNTQPLALNENFTSCHNTANDFDRIFQMTDNELNHFVCDISITANSSRKMKDFAEPSIADVQESDGKKTSLPYGGTRL